LEKVSIFYLASSMTNHIVHERLREALDTLQEIEDQLIMEIAKNEIQQEKELKKW
jgi:hypothetical protein